MSKGQECDSLLNEKQIQLDATENINQSLKQNLDSSKLSGQIKNKIINIKTAENAKLDRKRKNWMYFGCILGAVFVFEEIIHQITLK